MADGRTVEERLRRLEDLEEIRALLVEYARCLDAGDHAAYADLFTEDGELRAQLGEAKGRKAIRELLDARLLDSGERARRTARHQLANPTITVDGDTATSTVLWLFVTHDDDGYPLLLQGGRYDDELVRDGGRWRFKRRTITRDFGYSPLDERARFDRLRQLEDREAIWRLFMDYRRELDRRDFAAYSLLFADDGEWLGDLGCAKGPAEIRALLERTLEVYEDDSTRTYHLVGNPEIDVSGDRATARSMWCFITRDESDRPTLSLVGHYEDELVRADGVWRFQRRVAYCDVPYVPFVPPP